MFVPSLSWQIFGDFVTVKWRQEIKDGFFRTKGWVIRHTTSDRPASINSSLPALSRPAAPTPAPALRSALRRRALHKKAVSLNFSYVYPKPVLVK
jgi:hypothetical protein